MLKRTLFSVLAGAAAAALSAGGAVAHPETEGDQAASGNGYDGDLNPAVNTRLIARIGDAAEAELDPPFKIVTFEAGPGHHGEAVAKERVDSRTVRFSPGLKRQLCDGRRYFSYDTECPYLAAPSGRFAAVYRDEWRRPLQIAFEEPVCAAALAVYPTGGAEGETFKVVLQPFTGDGAELEKVEYEFNWTHDTFRWRLMAGAFFFDRKAGRLDVSVESKADKSKIVRFLIDDVAFIEDDCALAIADINAEGGLAPAEAPAESAPADLVPDAEEISGS